MSKLNEVKMQKKIHELIEMAKNGEKFEACPIYDGIWYNQDRFKNGDFKPNEITTEWSVRIKREPRVMWFPEYANGKLGVAWDQKKDAANWGKPIKFIEVIED